MTYRLSMVQGSKVLNHMVCGSLTLNRMHSEHKRYYGLGMDALVIGFTRV